MWDLKKKKDCISLTVASSLRSKFVLMSLCGRLWSIIGILVWEQPSDQITLFQGSDELTDRSRLEALLGLLFIL